MCVPSKRKRESSLVSHLCVFWTYPGSAKTCKKRPKTWCHVMTAVVTTYLWQAAAWRTSFVYFTACGRDWPVNVHSRRGTVCEAVVALCYLVEHLVWLTCVASSTIALAVCSGRAEDRRNISLPWWTYALLTFEWAAASAVLVGTSQSLRLFACFC